MSLFAWWVANALVDARGGIIVQSINSCCYSLLWLLLSSAGCVNGIATGVQWIVVKVVRGSNSQKQRQGRAAGPREQGGVLPLPYNYWTHDHIYLYCTGQGYAISDTSDGIAEYAFQTEGNSFPVSI